MKLLTFVVMESTLCDVGCNSNITNSEFLHVTEWEVTDSRKQVSKRDPFHEEDLCGQINYFLPTMT